MPTLEEELKFIRSLTDPAKVRDKRSSRKGQLTKLESQVRTLQDTPYAEIRPSDIDKKLKEATRSSNLFDALQEQYEDLLQGTESSNIKDEVSRGELVREENYKIVEILEVLQEKINLYDVGMVVLDSLVTLSHVDDITKPIYTAELQKLREQTSDFKKNTRCFTSDPEIDRLRSQIISVTKEV